MTKRRKDPRQQPLEVKVSGGVLTISIGIGALQWAAENPPDGRDPLKVIDPKEFAVDVQRALEHEQEDGTTPVHLLLDDAIEEAANQGSLGLDYE